MNGKVTDRRSIASLSLDLDNKWSYLRTHGDTRWEAYPSYLPKVVPIILRFLKQRDLTITFFVVGQDVLNEAHHGLFRDIVASGHEIANHSLNHLPWLHLLSREELDREIRSTQEAISEVCGVEMTGFRGPGFSISQEHLAALAEQHYAYDASTFPNILNPIARAYFFSKSKLTDEEKEQRKGLFGTYRDALRPLKPFQWNLGQKSLLEIPVTTMPLLRIPIHFSYLIYLASYSKQISKAYFRLALMLCRLTRTSPSLLLHPLDFLGREDEQDLDFFPGMSLSRIEKISILDDCLDALTCRHRVVTMAEHAQTASEGLRNEKRMSPSQSLEH